MILRIYILVWALFLLVVHTATVQTSYYNGNEKRIAMVIGVSGYTQMSPLANPKNDANGMSAALERLGFDVIKLIDPTVLELKSAELDFVDGLLGADIALLYYAGHSLQIDNSNYLIPIDASLNTLSALPSETFQLAKLVNRMDKLAKTKIIILDACRDNPMLPLIKEAALREGRGRNVGIGLGSIDLLVDNEDLLQVELNTFGTVVSYAAAPGTLAEDGNGTNSPYTAALLKLIEQPGLEIGRMFRQVAADVIGETNGRQKPEYLVKLSDEFYFKNPEPDQCDFLAGEPINNLSIRGVDFDRIIFGEAEKACKNALSQDPEHPRYIHNLARVYDSARKYNLAIPLYEQSAKLGFVHSINNLGAMHINGQGVAQNFARGISLLKTARSLGHIQARVNLQSADFSVLMKELEFKKVQERMGVLGIYSGVIDGDFGNASKLAILEYQKNNKLAENGLTLETMDSLEIIDAIPKFRLD